MTAVKAVVFLGMNPWRHEEINDTVRLLAKAMQGVERLYVDPPLGIRAALLKPAYFLRSLRWGRDDGGGITCLSPPLGFLPVRGGLRSFTNALWAAGLEKFLRSRYGGGWRESVLFYVSSWSYTLGGMLARLRPGRMFFHLLDDNFAFPQVAGDPATLELNRSFFGYMMKESTVAAAVSKGLAEKYGKIYGRRIALVRNGVDCRHFAPPAEEMAEEKKTPADLAGIPRPLLLYAGSINAWVDLDLLTALADLRPRYALVLVGHYYPGAADGEKWARLLSRSNVFYLSSRPYGELPAYLQEAAVLLLPRTAAEHSLHSDPLKLYEYLATGKPVVSTALPAVEEFREYVYVGTAPPEFVRRVDEALAGHSEEKSRRQIEAVAGHSWAERAREILRLVEGEGGKK